MIRLMFWRVDDNLYNADEQLRDGAVAIRKKVTPTTNPEDVQLLEDALHHLCVASMI